MSAETVTLTLRLLRKGRDIESAVEAKFRADGDRPLQSRPWVDAEGAQLLVGQLYHNPPPWLEVLSRSSTDLPDVHTGGAGAVIFMPVRDRVVAICFGHIHLALNLDAFERQFGLKVTLNAVPKAGLRTLDLATPDAVTFQKRIQASRDSDIREFGVDVYRDLARVAGGTPRNPSFAQFLAGKDSLSITCKLEMSRLHAKCIEVLDVFAKNDYRADYEWVDNLRQVEERDIRDKLDAALFAALDDLRAGNDAALHMSPPEVIDYTEGNVLHYNGFGSSGTNFFSLSIVDYVAELNRCGFKGDIDEIKQFHRVATKPTGGTEFNLKWKVYDCFTFETELVKGKVGKHFVLFSGAWYQVDKQFKQRIDNFFLKVPREIIVAKTTARNEQELIVELQARSDLIMLDRTKINPAGTKNAFFEPCDFFSEDKKFIHLKDGHSSGQISHLWSQGVVSAEAFVGDGKFRGDLRRHVKQKRSGWESKLPMTTQNPVRADYPIVYGIMRKPRADGTLDLPFFSKVSFSVAAQRLQQLGFPVAINLIEKPASDAGSAESEE